MGRTHRANFGSLTGSQEGWLASTINSQPVNALNSQSASTNQNIVEIVDRLAYPQLCQLFRGFGGGEFAAIDLFENFTAPGFKLILLRGFDLKAELPDQLIEPRANDPIGDAKLALHLFDIATALDKRF